MVLFKERIFGRSPYLELELKQAPWSRTILLCPKTLDKATFVKKISTIQLCPKRTQDKATLVKHPICHSILLSEISYSYHIEDQQQSQIIEIQRHKLGRRYFAFCEVQKRAKIHNFPNKFLRLYISVGQRNIIGETRLNFLRLYISGGYKNTERRQEL